MNEEMEFYSDGNGVIVRKLHLNVQECKPTFSTYNSAYALITTDIKGVYGNSYLYFGTSYELVNSRSEYNHEPYSVYMTKYDDAVWYYGIDNETPQTLSHFRIDELTGLYVPWVTSSATVRPHEWDGTSYSYEYLPKSERNPRNAGELHRVEFGIATIPVQWKSTRYEKTYQDSFNMSVTKPLET